MRFQKVQALLVVLLILDVATLSLMSQHVSATHNVTADPPGGVYNTSQTVTLASDTGMLIFYTTDGSPPTNVSTPYTAQIPIDQTTTLKFIAFDPSDNHTSSSVTESYIIDTGAPLVVSTSPEDGSTRVDPRTTHFDVEFNEPMDESTLNSDNIAIADSAGNAISGEISYNPDNFTATFSFDEGFSDGCEQCLKLGRLYTVSLGGNITDSAGNHLEPFSFDFRTGGSITINIIDTLNSEFIGDASIAIDPDPFDLSGSLVVQDDSDEDLDFILFDEKIPGTLVLFNVEFASYNVNELPPENYVVLYENLIITVHDTNRRASGAFRNIPDSASLDDVPPVLVPPPNLNEDQFALYEGSATRGIFSGVKGTELGNRSPISTVGPNAIPDARLASQERVGEITFAIESVVFNITAPASSTGQELFESFLVPTYPNPTESVAPSSVYVVPAFVIPYEGTNNNFVLTPVIGKVFPGMGLSLKQASFVETNVAKVERINMTFNRAGTDVGFSFGISDTTPPGTPNPPLDAPALFLDVGFIGDIDFSDPSAFQISPNIDILVNKTLPGFPELPNGCPDFRLLFFNGNEWEEVQKLNPTGNFTDFCPFTLLPEHFSKFAVGGVKGVSTEASPEINDRHGGGGGGRSRSTAVTQTPTGSDVETSINTKSGEVVVQFEHVEEGSGQLKIEANELSVFEGFFEDVVFLQDDGQHGILSVDGKTYATAGEVFDIDASSVKYSGKVDVTIPYDEEAANSIGSESEIRFLHYNEQFGIWEDVTTSVDEFSNTVTGTLDSFSPVTAAIVIGNGDNVDNSLIEIPQQLEITQPEISISQSEVLISTELSNPATANQDFVMIVQVQDAQGIVQQIRWQAGILPASKADLISMSLNSLDAGDYTIKIIVVNNMENPWLLSYSETGLGI